MDQVFFLKGAWQLMFNGIVPTTTWPARGPAEVQLYLLRKGYSVLTPEGSIKHLDPKSDSMLEYVRTRQVDPATGRLTLADKAVNRG
jgi:hypothetical protein